MIKQLPLLYACFISLTVYSQSTFIQQRAGLFNHQAAKFREYDAGSNCFRNLRLKIPVQTNAVNKPAGPSPTTVNWDLLCGSMNIEGMLNSSAQPLQYEPTLNAVSFIHRKSDTYTTSSVLSSSAQSGVVVAEVSTNWGQSWDSTAIWDDNSNWGRSPQGGIYNPAQNTLTVNSFVVATGVTEGSNGMSGNFYASKSLNGYSNAGSAAPGSQYFYAFNSGSYPPGQAAHSLSRSSFVVTNDGLLRSAGIVQSNYADVKSIRGFAVATGSLAGPSVVWTVDTLIPPCMTKGNGERHLLPDPRMAFNQAGTIGYLVGIGVLSNAVNSNKGYQPIIYKMDRTINANATWTLMPAMNFNSPGFKPLVKSTNQGHTGLVGIYISGNDTLGVPFVEDYDIVVDKDNKLHLAATLMSTASNHMDSLQFAVLVASAINFGELYKWRHAPGSRPYLYDFLGNGTGPWTVFTIDSLSSESCGGLSSEPGYSENPWDVFDSVGMKPTIGSRIQLGRSPLGESIIFSWAESDSAFTNNQYKWNTLPNLKARLMYLNNFGYLGYYHLNEYSEQNMSFADPDVSYRSTLHYMSPLSSTSTIKSTSNYFNVEVKLRMPFTITNSNPYSPSSNNSTWYGDAEMSYFININTGCGGPTDYTPPLVGLIEDKADLSFVLHPNPVKDELSLSVDVVAEGNIEMQIKNGLGQPLAGCKRQTTPGPNVIKINVNDLPPGIYFLTAERAGVRVTKKFLKE